MVAAARTASTRAAACIPSRGQQQIAGGERPAHGAGRVGEIQHAGAPAGRVDGALHDGVGQRIRRAGHEGRQPDLDEHRPQVEPDLSHRAPGRTERRQRCGDGFPTRGQIVGARPDEAAERGGHEDRVRRNQQIGGTAQPSQQPAARDRAGPAGHQQHREHEREHRTESSEQDAEMPQPQHLQPHHGTARQRERESRRGHEAGGNRVAREWIVRDGLANRTVHVCRRRDPERGPREPGSHEVQRHGHELRGLEPRHPHQHEVGEQRAGGRAGRIGAIEPRDRPAGVESGLRERANEQCQRRTHRQGDGRQQPDRERRAHDVRRRRQLVPAVDAGHVSRPPGHDGGQMRQDEREPQAEACEHGFRVRVEPDQPRRPRPAVPIGPHAGEVAAGAEPEHEHGDDDRRRVHRVAEDVAELADPGDLVDQAADAGEEKRREEKGTHGYEWQSGQSRQSEQSG